MLFSYCYGQQQIGYNKKCGRIAGNFDCHADAAVQHGGHRPIEQNQGFLRSHWMPLLGECLHRIAPAADIVDEFGRKTQNPPKKLF